MKENCNNVLVVLANESYLEHAKHLFINSIVAGGWTDDLCLMKYGSKTKNDDWFLKNGISIYYIERGLWGNVPEKTEILLSKFHIVHPFMKKWDKLLFLDCDIIINGPLQGLLRFEGHHAVPGILFPYLKNRLSTPKLSEFFKYINFKSFELKINTNSSGFNGGLYLIDLNKITNSTFYDGLNFFKKYRDFLNLDFGDEALIASFFSREIQPLPLCYNVFMNFNTSTSGIILHYLGKNKPWHQSHPMYHNYIKNLQLSDKFSSLKPLKKYSDYEIKEMEKNYQEKLQPKYLEISKQPIEEFKSLYKNLI